MRTDIQSRPILTLAPITAPDPMIVPAPISAFGPDHGERIDSHVVFQACRWIDDGGGSNADTEQGLRTEHVALQHARDLHEFRERLLGADNRNMEGNPGLEALVDQTSPGFGWLS